MLGGFFLQNLKKNVLLGLTYLLTIVFPLIVIFTYKNPDPDDDTRFHVCQALTMHFILFTLYISSLFLFFIPVLPFILSLLYGVVAVCVLVFAIMAFCDKFIHLDFLNPLTNVVEGIFYKNQQKN
jgi:hypothetical protein